MHGKEGACNAKGVCMVKGGVWQKEACMAKGGGMHGIQGDAINEQAVCILLECVLVRSYTIVQVISFC